jgi:hypothetical protein
VISERSENQRPVEFWTKTADSFIFTLAVPTRQGDFMVDNSDLVEELAHCEQQATVLIQLKLIMDPRVVGFGPNS